MGHVKWLLVAIVLAGCAHQPQWQLVKVDHMTADETYTRSLDPTGICPPLKGEVGVCAYPPGWYVRVVTDVNPALVEHATPEPNSSCQPFSVLEDEHGQVVMRSQLCRAPLPSLPPACAEHGGVHVASNDDIDVPAFYAYCTDRTIEEWRYQ